MFAAIKIDLVSGDIEGIKLALKLDAELNSIKDLARGLIFTDLLISRRVNMRYHFFFFFLAEGIFFIIVKKTVGFDDIFVASLKKYNFRR